MIDLLAYEVRHLGDRVRMTRLARRITQRDVAIQAQALGRAKGAGFATTVIHEAHISLLERGGALDRERRKAILKALDLDERP